MFPVAMSGNAGAELGSKLLPSKPSGNRSASDIMKITLLITMETLIKTEVCHYSGSAQNSGNKCHCFAVNKLMAKLLCTLTH